MKRPKPIPLDQIDLVALAQEVQGVFEDKLDWLDQVWNEGSVLQQRQNI